MRRSIKIADHAIPQRPAMDRMLTVAADQVPGFLSDRNHLPGFLVQRHHRRFIENDPLASHIDQAIGCAQIHCHIMGQVVQHPT